MNDAVVSMPSLQPTSSRIGWTRSRSRRFWQICCIRTDPVSMPKYRPTQPGLRHRRQQRLVDAVDSRRRAPAIAATVHRLAELDHLPPVDREHVVVQLEVRDAVSRVQQVELPHEPFGRFQPEAALKESGRGAEGAREGTATAGLDPQQVQSEIARPDSGRTSVIGSVSRSSTFGLPSVKHSLPAGCRRRAS